MDSLLRKIYQVFSPSPLQPSQQNLYVNLDEVRGRSGIVQRMAQKPGDRGVAVADGANRRRRRGDAMSGMLTKTSGFSDVAQLDSARQAGDLAALRRMLEAARGCFSLSFAVCDDRALRNDLVARLREEFPGVVVVELPTQAADVYQAVCEQLAGAAADAVFVLDLEASVPFEAGFYPTLRALNASRELWEGLHCPVVFWLAGYAAALVASKAPDFWSYRSHQFEFVSDRASAREAVDEPFRSYAMVDALPAEEKRFRIAELEQRLSDAGKVPPRDILEYVLEWTHELAHLYQHANRWDDAEELLRHAVQLAEEAYGADDVRFVVALNNWAKLLEETNRLTEAEVLYNRCLSIDEMNAGSEHPAVASTLHNLAGLLVKTNRLSEAERLYRRALAICESNLGQGHPKTAMTLNNLAGLLRETGRQEEAEQAYHCVLSNQEACYGPKHPAVAAGLNNFAGLLQESNRLDEAERLYRRAIAINEASFGPMHSTVAIGLNNLAGLLRVTNRLEEAERLYRRSLAIDETSYGPEHPVVAIALNNLGCFLHETDRLMEAEPYLRRALRILAVFTERTGHDHPHRQATLNNYSTLLKAMGKSDGEIQAEIDSLRNPPTPSITEP